MAWPESTRLRDAWQEVTSQLADLTQHLLKELLPEQGANQLQRWDLSQNSQSAYQRWYIFATFDVGHTETTHHPTLQPNNLMTLQQYPMTL